MKNIAEIEESESSHNSSGSNDEHSKKQANSSAPPLPSSPSKKENASSDEEMDNSAKISHFKLYSFADSLDTIMIAVGAIAAAASGVSFPIYIILFGNLIDTFGKESGTSKLLDEVAQISLLLIYLAIGSGFSSSLQVICWTISSERQTWRIRNSYLKSILRQEIALFDKDGNTGKVIGRLSVDTALIQISIGEQMGLFIQSFALFIGGYAVAFYQGWLLTLIMISSIPPLLIASVVMFRIQNKFSLHEQAAYGEAANIVEQTISSIRTVVSFNGEKKAVDSYNQNLKIAESKSRRQEFGKGLSGGVAISFIYFGWALGVWYGGRLILNSGYTGGKVVNVILSVLISSFALGQMSPCLSAFSEGKAAGYKIFQTIYREPEIDSSDNSGKILDNIHGDIELRDVVFSYPTRSDDQIFSGLSLSINSGMSTALVGESGSGKSTVISLIERFYDPQSGQVLIDGINLKDFKLRWIRGKIGLVSQEPVLFSTTLQQNIAYGKDGATLQEIKTAVELANATKFIDKMPQGLGTMVGENGTQLSGGQKQRIAIARAILKDPKILLLDEATSALDVESERIVQDALDRVMKNRTTVVVAHRLSTVKNVDMIEVISHGFIVEKGSHSELIMKQDGAYSKLVQLQEANKDDLSINIASMGRRGSSLSLELSKRRFSSFYQDRIDQLQSKVEITTHDNESNTTSHPDISIRRLAYLNRTETPFLVLGTIFSFLIGLIRPIYGLFLAQIISSFYQPPSKLKKETNLWGLLFLCIGLFTLITVSIRSYMFAVAGSKLVKRVRYMFFKKVVAMEVGWFDNFENSSGAIGTRLSKDASTIKTLVGESLAIAVENGSLLIAALTISFIASWRLSLIILVLVPLSVANIMIQTRLLKPILQKAKVLYEEASQIANNAVGNIRTIASFSVEEKIIELFKNKCEIPIKSVSRAGLISGVGYGISNFMLYSIFAAIFYIGGKFVEDGKIEFSDVFRVFFVLLMAFLGLFRNSTIGPDYINAKNAIASVFAILDRESKIDSEDDSGTVLEQVRGNIEFRHVNFSYPTRPDLQIFLDFNFTIHSRKVTALVGESGCGKSTVISLLQRFYNLDSGNIFLDGNNIKGLNLKWFRSQMGLVSQEPVLFNNTIRANIAYGKKDEATESDIIVSAESANAHKFISALPQGYDTLVGERGIQLSGGQKQRIAIARAIVKEPKILLLDEATSALDAESERVVQDALEKIMVNRTTIVVAHRLSTIKGADMIAVVKDGSIVEKGKHDVLVNIKDGAYASLLALNPIN